MKCSKCGFISRRDFYRCPYCGHTNEEDFEGIRKRINLGHDFSAQIRTIIIVFVVNLFLLSVLLDWYFQFKYAICLWSYFVLFGSLVVMDAVSSKKGSLITSLEKMDLFLLGYLLLACVLCKMGPEEAILFDARAYFPSLIIPGYLILTAIISTFVVLLRKSKMRPIFTEIIFVLHFIMATILFIFLLINKYAPTAPFKFLLFEDTGSAKEALCLASEILIFVAFGLSVIYLVNYNIVLVGSIFRKVKRIYGGERD